MVPLVIGPHESMVSRPIIAYDKQLRAAVIGMGK
jgi:hypothetical protein